MVRRLALALGLAALIGLTGQPALAAPDLTAAPRAYVAALVSHDGYGVPFTDDATRVEAGLQTGFSGAQLRADLTYGLQYKIIQKVRNERYSVSGNVVTVDYDLDVGVLGVKLLTTRIHETFALKDGKIQRIVADIAL